MARRSEELFQQIKTAAENDLKAFIALVQPYRALGHCHEDMIDFWQNPETGTHQLVLFPRDHCKSALIGLRCAHAVIRNPAIRILYISSTANLATKQLKFIKDILTSDVVRRYWPDLIHPDEGKREKWTETEISVDHPKRKAEYIRDPTVFTAGLTTNIVGLHCDISVFDDVVTNDTAYIEENRKKLETQYSLLASIEGAESQQWVVGTRYHPLDLYNTMLEMEVPTFNEDGEETSSRKLYSVLERQVETGGVFLWPRQQNTRGQWFGFNQEILARKKTQYIDKVQFYAQYYNNPNDPLGAGISRENFQYYEPHYIKRKDGQWYFKDRKLNLSAAMDFAYSTGIKSDYTSIVVVGVDAQHNYFVLDIDRFKTDQPSVYFEHLLKLHQKWDFRKIKMEATAAQITIINTIKTTYIRPHGLALAVEEFRPTRNDGTKDERIASILQPRYNTNSVWHFRGGYCQTLEEELVLQNPPHKDIKDALATAVDAAFAPSGPGHTRTRPEQLSYHHRFGGIY